MAFIQPVVISAVCLRESDKRLHNAWTNRSHTSRRERKEQTWEPTSDLHPWEEQGAGMNSLRRKYLRFTLRNVCHPPNHPLVEPKTNHSKNIRIKSLGIHFPIGSNRICGSIIFPRKGWSILNFRARHGKFQQYGQTDLSFSRKSTHGSCRLTLLHSLFLSSSDFLAWALLGGGGGGLDSAVTTCGLACNAYVSRATIRKCSARGGLPLALVLFYRHIAGCASSTGTMTIDDGRKGREIYPAVYHDGLSSTTTTTMDRAECAWPVVTNANMAVDGKSIKHGTFLGGAFRRAATSEPTLCVVLSGTVAPTPSPPHANNTTTISGIDCRSTSSGARECSTWRGVPFFRDRVSPSFPRWR